MARIKYDRTKQERLKIFYCGLQDKMVYIVAVLIVFSLIPFYNDEHTITKEDVKYVAELEDDYNWDIKMITQEGVKLLISTEEVTDTNAAKQLLVTLSKENTLLNNPYKSENLLTKQGEETVEQAVLRYLEEGNTLTYTTKTNTLSKILSRL